MKSTLKRFIIAFLAMAMALTSLAGCSSIKDSDVVATVDGVDIPLNVANFYARVIYQVMYDSQYMSMMGEDMWEKDYGDGVTMEESTKETIMDSLKQMYILEAHMEDYDVEITEEEQAEIKEAAKAFMENNDDEAIKVLSASEEVAERVLTLYTIHTKVKAVIVEGADMEVSDEEAAQKKMLYAKVANTTSSSDDEEEEAEELTSEELKAEAQAIVTAVEGGAAFEETVTDAGYYASDVTFDSEYTYPTEDVIKAADELKEGEVVLVEDEGEEEDAYYAVYLESEFDRDATDTKKDSIREERKEEFFTEEYEKLEEEVDFTLNKSVWKKVSFIKQGVTYKIAEEEDTPEPDDVTPDTDEELTGEDTPEAADAPDTSDDEQADDDANAEDENADAEEDDTDAEE